MKTFESMCMLLLTVSIGAEGKPKQNEVSFAYEQTSETRMVVFSKAFSAPEQWKENCLAVGVTDSKDFVDCFDHPGARLKLRFGQDSSFQLSHGDLCLEWESEHLVWNPCLDHKQSQRFERVLEPNYLESENQFQKYKFRNLSSQELIFGGKFFYIRDYFPRIPIKKPLLNVPEKAEWTNFIANAQIRSPRKNNIVLIWLDTIRKDYVREDLTPNLFQFSRESLGFRRNFASGTATRASGFSLWNSRASTEWKHFRNKGYGASGSLNLNVLDKLGYDVQAYASVLPVIDENLFLDSGQYLVDADEVFPNVCGEGVLLHRRVFDFKKPVAVRRVDSSRCMSLKTFNDLPFIELDKRVVNIFLEDLRSYQSQGQASFIWLTGAHTPYIPDPDRMIREPAFSPKSSLLTQQTQEWLDWFYRDGVRHPDWVANSYANAVASVDRQLGRILRGLKESGLYDESIVVVMSDHGESLFENSHFGHGGPPMLKLVDAPLYIKFPRSQKVQVPVRSYIASHVDVFPSIFDYLGVDFGASRYQTLVSGLSIFKDKHTCKISSEPNGYGYSTIEFSFLSKDKKLRVRFEKKEKTAYEFSDLDNPLGSDSIEVMGFTDWEDRPLDICAHVSPAECTDQYVVSKIKRTFKDCLTSYL